MRIKKIRAKPLDKSETIWETDARPRKEALELAEKHKDIKVEKYLLK